MATGILLSLPQPVARKSNPVRMRLTNNVTSAQLAAELSKHDKNGCEDGTAMDFLPRFVLTAGCVHFPILTNTAAAFKVRSALMSAVTPIGTSGLITT
jgi:hypothetical protein